MDLRTLKTFQLIVKHGSFIRAAEELNYAQSTVTMQIQKLEAELGLTLLERDKSGLRLTEAGRLFYAESQAIVGKMERLRSTLADLRTGEAGSVRIGVTEPTASLRLPPLLAAFTARYPAVRVSVEVASTQALTELLRHGELDFALCSAPGEEAEVYFDPLLREAFAVLLPEGHPLAAREAVDLAGLARHRLLITAATCPYRRKLVRTLKEQGIDPEETMEIGSMTALHKYVEAGLGIALVPRILVSPPPPGTTVRPLDGPPIDMALGLACLSAAYPLAGAAGRLYDMLREALGQD